MSGGGGPGPRPLTCAECAFAGGDSAPACHPPQLREGCGGREAAGTRGFHPPGHPVGICTPDVLLAAGPAASSAGPPRACSWDTFAGDERATLRVGYLGHSRQVLGPEHQLGEDGAGPSGLSWALEAFWNLGPPPLPTSRLFPRVRLQRSPAAPASFRASDPTPGHCPRHRWGPRWPPWTCSCPSGGRRQTAPSAGSSRCPDTRPLCRRRRTKTEGACVTRSGSWYEAPTRRQRCGGRRGGQCFALPPLSVPAPRDQDRAAGPPGWPSRSRRHCGLAWGGACPARGWPWRPPCAPTPTLHVSPRPVNWVPWRSTSGARSPPARALSAWWVPKPRPPAPPHSPPLRLGHVRPRPALQLGSPSSPCGTTRGRASPTHLARGQGPHSLHGRHPHGAVLIEGQHAGHCVRETGPWRGHRPPHVRPAPGHPPRRGRGTKQPGRGAHGCTAPPAGRPATAGGPPPRPPVTQSDSGGRSGRRSRSHCPKLDSSVEGTLPLSHLAPSGGGSGSGTPSSCPGPGRRAAPPRSSARGWSAAGPGTEPGGLCGEPAERDAQVRTPKPWADGPPNVPVGNCSACHGCSRDCPAAFCPHSGREETKAQEAAHLLTVTLGEQPTALSTRPASSSLTVHRPLPGARAATLLACLSKRSPQGRSVG